MDFRGAGFEPNLESRIAQYRRGTRQPLDKHADNSDCFVHIQAEIDEIVGRCSGFSVDTVQHRGIGVIDARQSDRVL